MLRYVSAYAGCVLNNAPFFAKPGNDFPLHDRHCEISAREPKTRNSMTFEETTDE
jgi:hypothetical protein